MKIILTLFLLTTTSVNAEAVDIESRIMGKLYSDCAGLFTIQASCLSNDIKLENDIAIHKKRIMENITISYTLANLFYADNEYIKKHTKISTDYYQDHVIESGGCVMYFTQPYTKNILSMCNATVSDVVLMQEIVGDMHAGVIQSQSQSKQRQIEP